MHEQVKDMKITRKYIMDNRTERGAWTQAQIEALGLTWPPRKGWIDRVCGNEISPANQSLFESKLKKAQYKKYKKPHLGVTAKELTVAMDFENAKKEALERHAAGQVAKQLDMEHLTNVTKIY